MARDWSLPWDRWAWLHLLRLLRKFDEMLQSTYITLFYSWSLTWSWIYFKMPNNHCYYENRESKFYLGKPHPSLWVKLSITPTWWGNDWIPKKTFTFYTSPSTTFDLFDLFDQLLTDCFVMKIVTRQKEKAFEDCKRNLSCHEKWTKNRRKCSDCTTLLEWKNMKFSCHSVFLALKHYNDDCKRKLSTRKLWLNPAQWQQSSRIISYTLSLSARVCAVENHHSPSWQSISK